MVAGLAAPGVGGTGPPTDNCGAHARELAYERVGCRGLVKLVAFDRWTESGRNKVEHFARAGMSVEGRLREEQLAIERHFEPAAAARQQRRAGDPCRPRVEELSWIPRLVRSTGPPPSPSRLTEGACPALSVRRSSPSGGGPAF